MVMMVIVMVINEEEWIIDAQIRRQFGAILILQSIAPTPANDRRICAQMPNTTEEATDGRVRAP
jgi:hypothetical protein